MSNNTAVRAIRIETTVTDNRSTKNPLFDRLFVAIQTILPHHLISRASHYLAESRIPWLKNAFIQWFIRQYDVDMSEALEEDPKAYAHFNDLFTRLLKYDARPMPANSHAVISPADGAISQLGDIYYGRLYQAKNHDFSLTELIGGDSALATELSEGRFVTIYLSPKDYHRVHMPAGGTLRRMIHVPGRLFSVNQATTENLPLLFARNERVVCIFDTEKGPMAVILVGAMIVASIETVWSGVVTPPRHIMKTFDYTEAGRQAIHLNRGDEMGRFKLGSTAIVLFGKDQMNWRDDLNAGDSVRMGQTIGHFR
ncbi:MAG: phosphatidylserine decarboxylase [Endozoicomonadaceae bacterium]|nr:phosphatidylserine decarboxylase [Endozoicomonadaceae bacterium]